MNLAAQLEKVVKIQLCVSTTTHPYFEKVCRQHVMTFDGQLLHYMPSTVRLRVIGSGCFWEKISNWPIFLQWVRGILGAILP